MDSKESSYCRFCAESRSKDKLLNFHNDDSIREDVVLKLTFVNAMYVDVSNCDLLPKTICLVCYDSLNKAYEFLEGVKRAQDVLSKILSSKIEKQCELSDDDHVSNFDDYLGNETPEDSTDAKLEMPESAINKGSSINDVFDVSVKLEPKEENEYSLPLSETLNVQDILDAAFQVPLSSNVTIYAKEVPAIKKKAITSWNTYPWICAWCKIEFINAEMLRNHSKVAHHKCFAFTCIDCKGEKKGRFKSFLKHVRSHRKCLRNVCFYCDERVDSGAMSSHIDQHYPKSQIPCHLCGEILKNDESLTQHLHDFSTGRKRKARRKRGTPITIEDTTCKICKKIYKNLNSLRDHMKLHISDRKKNYTCDRCGKNFFNKGTLTSHIMSHDKIKPHVCRICNKSFMFPNMLRRHVDMHTGVKPYPCDQCGRCFRLKHQLNSHKIVHTDNMPYVCQYCSKAFRFKQILKNHELQHTGSKPYSCQQCGMEFTNWSNYNKHMKRRHNVDTSKKKITPEGTFPINPETGHIIRVEESLVTEEWKTKIMRPVKRGKKKAIKTEENGSLL